MARFLSLTGSQATVETAENPHVFSILGDFCQNRLEELNTYSDCLTRFFRVSGRFAERRFDTA
jgi:hypothetical protein